jgi:hypothetical protein
VLREDDGARTAGIAFCRTQFPVGPVTARDKMQRVLSLLHAHPFLTVFGVAVYVLMCLAIGYQLG